MAYTYLSINIVRNFTVSRSILQVFDPSVNRCSIKHPYDINASVLYTGHFKRPPPIYICLPQLLRQVRFFYSRKKQLLLWAHCQKVKGGFFLPALICLQYSPMNERVGGGCQRAPTDSGTFAVAKVRLAKIAQFIAIFRLKPSLPI